MEFLGQQIKVYTNHKKLINKTIKTEGITIQEGLILVWIPLEEIKTVQIFESTTSLKILHFTDNFEQCVIVYWLQKPSEDGIF